jgi:hypothetical protein
MSRTFDYATLASEGLSAHNSFDGFSQTSQVLSQLRVSPAHRCSLCQDNCRLIGRFASPKLEDAGIAPNNPVTVSY